MQHTGGHHRRIVDQHGTRAEALLEGLDGALNLGFVADTGLQSDGLAACLCNFIHDLLAGVALQIEHAYASALQGEPHSNAASNASRSARDERDFVP